MVSRKLLHIRYAAYLQSGLDHPQAGDGMGCALLTLDAAFAGTPDDGWLQARLPRARAVFRSNSRDVQARMCALGRGVAVLPIPLGDRTPGIERVDLGDEPPGRDTWIGYHRDLGRMARLRALLDRVIAHLAD